MTRRFPFQFIDFNQPLVDPRTGRITPYFQRQLFGQTENAEDVSREVDAFAAAILALQQQKADKTTLINPGFGLSGGGDLSADRTLSLGNPALSDPGEDRVLFWDDSAGQLRWLKVGTNLTITDDTINASGGGGGGGLYPVNNPAATTFPNSFLGTGVSLSLADTAYGCYFQRSDSGTASADRVGIRGTSVPNSNWRATLGVRVTPFSAESQFIRQGIGCTNGTGAITAHFNTQNGSPALISYFHANLNTFTSSVGAGAMWSLEIVFLRLERVGTNIISSYSIDGGRTWIRTATRAIGSFINPTHVGLYSNSFSTITPEFTGMAVFYWELV